MTGLSKEVAKFQARSGLSGTGFTTEEAEHFMNHAVRRRIIMLLITLQQAGIITAVSALMHLPKEGILVLGIFRRDGTYVGIPRSWYTINTDETLVLYGSQDSLMKLQQRTAGASGEKSHKLAETDYKNIMREQDREERAYQAQQAQRAKRRHRGH